MQCGSTNMCLQLGTFCNQGDRDTVTHDRERNAWRCELLGRERGHSMVQPEARHERRGHGVHRPAAQYHRGDAEQVSQGVAFNPLGGSRLQEFLAMGEKELGRVHHGRRGRGQETSSQREQNRDAIYWVIRSWFRRRRTITCGALGIEQG